jgi:hypothetical protein
VIQDDFKIFNLNVSAIILFVEKITILLLEVRRWIYFWGSLLPNPLHFLTVGTPEGPSAQ